MRADRYQEVGDQGTHKTSLRRTYHFESCTVGVVLELSSFACYLPRLLSNPGKEHVLVGIDGNIIAARKPKMEKQKNKKVCHSTA